MTILSARLFHLAESLFSNAFRWYARLLKC